LFIAWNANYFKFISGKGWFHPAKRRQKMTGSALGLTHIQVKALSGYGICGLLFLH
jgi:hypothetical protein